MGKKSRASQEAIKGLAPEGTPRREAICSLFIKRCLADHGYAVDTLKFGQGSFEERLEKLKCCVDIHERIGVFCLHTARTYESQARANTVKELRDMLITIFKGWASDLDQEAGKLKNIARGESHMEESLIFIQARRERDMKDLNKIKTRMGLL